MTLSIRLDSYNFRIHRVYEFVSRKFVNNDKINEFKIKRIGRQSRVAPSDNFGIVPLKKS